MNIYAKRNSINRANELRTRPPIPELPQTLDELNKLFKKSFKVIWRTSPVSENGGEYHPGGIAIVEFQLECPFCGMKFGAIGRSGCFTCDVYPHTCPNCDFSSNVIKTIVEKLPKNI